MNNAGQSSWNNRKEVFQTAGGGCLAFVRGSGHGPDAVFVHGFSDTSRSFSLIEGHLSKLRFIAPDLPGHGGSSIPVGGFSLDHLASLLAEFVAGIAREPPLLVGHSLGAIITIRMLARRPQAARAALLISPSLKPGSDSRLGRWIGELSGPASPSDPFFDYWHGTAPPLSGEFSSFMRQEAAALEMATWHGIFNELREADLRDDARQMRCPVVTICGSSDPLFDDDHQRLATELLRPIAQFRMDGLGHNPHWEEPGKVANIVNRFAKPGDLQAALP